MPADLRMTCAQHDALRAHLLQDEDEHAAVLICGTAGPQNLLVCRRVVPLAGSDLLSSGEAHLHVSPFALARIAKEAAGERATLVVCHSHPFPGEVHASPIDLVTEEELCGRVLPGRLSGRPVGALILGPDGSDGRLWRDGDARPLGLVVGGSRIGAGSAELPEGDSTWARQLLVWGSEGQRRLRDACVGIVGAGGTGSHVIVQLAHLGVGGLVLVDHDIVERSNLSRIVGADRDDLGRLKVDALAAEVSRINPRADVEVLGRSLVDLDAAWLARCDVIVCCTDGHGSRAVLTELGAQYLLPIIDLGIEVQAAGTSTRAGGGVRVVRPGGGCLHCAGILDPALVRAELLSDQERRAEQALGYLRGLDEPEPSVIALNGVVASLAVVEVLDLLLDVFARKPTRLLYRADVRTVGTAEVEQDPACFVCGTEGLIGLGDARALPRRKEQPRPSSA